MRSLLLSLMYGLLPLATGCLSDPVVQALSGEGPQPTAEKRTKREQVVSAVALCGGKIQFDLAELDKPVINAELRGIRSPGAVLESLGTLRKLRELDVYKTEFGDADLERFRGLSELRSLNLAETQVTDAGLACLEGLPQLRELYLNNTQVSNAGLEHLRRMPALSRLAICGSRVTDDGLAQLASLKVLDTLVIGGWSITDQGLANLQGLRCLKKLTIAGSPRVTKAGIAALKGALPKLAIIR